MWLTHRAWLWRSQVKVLLLKQVMSQLKFGVHSWFWLCSSRMVSYTFFVEAQPACYQHNIIQQHLIGCCHPLPSPTLNTGGYVKAKTSLHFWSPWGHICFESGFSFGSNPPISCYCPWKRECDSVASPGCNGLICTLLCTVEGRGNQCYLGADFSSLMIASCSYAKHL